MSLTFDTGLSRSTRELIVGALAAKLDGLRRPTKYLVRIASLSRVAGGKADEDFLIDLAKAVNGQVPCVAIATGRATAEGDGLEAIQLAEEIEIGIYVVSANQRGVVDGRLFVDVTAATDDARDPGVFAMLQHVAERIAGADLGVPGVDVPRKVDEDEIWSGDDVTIWGQVYRVRVEASVNPNRDGTELMTSIEAQHEGDGIPDASSLDPFVTTITTLDP